MHYFKCPYCDKKNKRLSSLKKHIFSIHFQNKYYCPYCNENFGNFESLQYHLRINIDDYHQNLYHLLTRRHIKFVDKKLFLAD